MIADENRNATRDGVEPVPAPAHGCGAVCVVGAGGHAKVVIATLRACGYAVGDLFDDDETLHGQSLLGHRVRGAVADLPEGAAIIAVGVNALRRRVAERTPQGRWLYAVHPAASVDHSVRIGEGSVIFAGAVVQPETQMGRHVIINTRASVDHDCEIGDFVHVAPGAIVAGDVRIGAEVLLGAGSVVLPGRTIGAGATVGAGAVVVRDVPPGMTVVGVPARPVA